MPPGVERVVRRSGDNIYMKAPPRWWRDVLLRDITANGGVESESRSAGHVQDGIGVGRSLLQ
jgi:hypothetical protein